MSTPQNPPPTKRREQIAATYRMAKQTDKTIGLWSLGAFLLGFAVGFGVLLLMPGSGTLSLVFAIVGGLLFGVLLGLMVFGRRAQAAAYGQWEGQPGAAAASLQMLKRGWKLDPTVGFTRQQDVVHRIVGPPGIVLVGEGNPARLRQLMANERRKHVRVVSDVPVHEVVCGNEEGQVPLKKLNRHVRKLGHEVKPAEMTDIMARLRAIDAHRSSVPMPKGPVPTSSKGLRSQMRQSQRGR